VLLSKYFLEVKNRLLLLFLTWLTTFVASYFYKETLLFLFVQPYALTDAVTSPTVFYFIFTGITEIFSVYIELVLFLSAQTVFFFSLYHLFLFLSPAMYYKEYSYSNLVLRTCLIVWCLSIILLTQIVIPLTWKFFLSFQYLTSSKSVNLYFEAKLNEYLTFYMSLYYLCVFYCQTFTVFFVFLNYIRANTEIIRRFRKLCYFVFFIFATGVSPPDILSQCLISTTIIFVYEVLVFTFVFRATTHSLVG